VPASSSNGGLPYPRGKLAFFPGIRLKEAPHIERGAMNACIRHLFLREPHKRPHGRGGGPLVSYEINLSTSSWSTGVLATIGETASKKINLLHRGVDRHRWVAGQLHRGESQPPTESSMTGWPSTPATCTGGRQPTSQGAALTSTEKYLKTLFRRGGIS